MVMVPKEMGHWDTLHGTLGHNLIMGTINSLTAGIVSKPQGVLDSPMCMPKFAKDLHQKKNFKLGFIAMKPVKRLCR